MISVEERFWAKVDKSPHPTGCWVWTAGKASGYGQFSIGRKFILAHRFAFENTKGPIPEGLLVCHSCDNKPCVNPAHLWTGTSLDNTRDAVAKGRTARGDRAGCRLHPETCARGLRNGAHTHPERIPRGDNHWARRRPEFLLRGERNGVSKLTTAAVLEIRARYAAGGITQAEIGKTYGVTKGAIKSVVNRTTWAHVPP